MNAKEAKTTFDTMMRYMKNIGKHMKSLSAQQSLLDAELQDLDHELRLSTLNDSELIDVSLERRRVLIELNVIKDELYVLTKVKDFSEDNFVFRDKLGSCVQAMDHTMKFQEDRVYTPRVRSGLKCAGIHM